MENPMDPANEAEGFIKERIFGYGYRWLPLQLIAGFPKKVNQKMMMLPAFQTWDMLNSNTLEGNDL